MLRAERDRLWQDNAELFEAMQHPSYEEENRLRAELAAARAELADTKATLDRVRDANRELREADATFLRYALDEARQCREQLFAQLAELAALRAQEPVADDAIRQAIARAWCNPLNAHKVMDQDLAEAAAAEVVALLAAQQQKDGGVE